MFDRYIGIDYSGAGTSMKRLEGLAVCCAVGNADPRPVRTDTPGAVRWTRQELACWLVGRLQEPCRTLVGIDHAFGFPMAYFRQYPEIAGGNWDDFLTDFRMSWRTHKDGVTVRAQYYEQIERMMQGNPEGCRFGIGDWFRLTDPPNASSVFDFLTKFGDVAHSTHAGLPWLLHIREELGDGVHFWPFDCWDISSGQSVVVEVYPALWNKRFPRIYGGRGGHEHDAYSVARWMSEKDQHGLIEQFFNPNLNGAQLDQAQMEGWIFGVMDPPDRN